MPSEIIFITGGNGGLGLAIAECFLSKRPHAHVILGVRKNRTRAQDLVDQSGGRVTLVSLDVVQVEEWSSAVAGIIQTHGRLDVLVNNAGGHEDALLAQMSDLAWHNVMTANLDSVFHGCKAVLPTMISQRYGRIVNISSLSALLAPPGQANYAAAKAGVLALTQSLAKEVARIGITVNSVCPGYIETEALSSMPDEERKAAAQRIPMRRLGRPAEVAAAIEFLACREASYITGSVIKVDGGIL